MENSELQPQFLVTVILDGLDWPPTMTENAQYALETELERMKDQGLILDYTLELK